MIEPGRKRRWVALSIALVAIACCVGLLSVVYRRADWPRWALARAREASAPWNHHLYALLARRYPALAPYLRLWAAEGALPTMDSVQALRDLAEYQPDGPVALQAHVALARYYADLESPETIAEYNAALAIDERTDIRLELAWYLEDEGATSSAYTQYLKIIDDGRHDAFVGARRTATNALTLARDLIDRGHAYDALDALYGVADCQAYCLRAEAYRRVGQYDDAAAMSPLCAACPDQAVATSGQAGSSGTSEAPSAASPIDLWKETWALEENADYAAALPIYLQVATTDSIYADDAAYRAWVLARRAGDAEASATALALLGQTQPSWLAQRATGTLQLCIGTDYPAEAVDGLAAPVLARVSALDELGLDDLAHQELRLAALVSEQPEMIQRMAQELLGRGYTTEAWSLASAYLRREACAPRAMWTLAYPRPYEELVLSSSEANGVDPALVWAVMRQESAYSPEVVSVAGAKGLMQIMPATQSSYCQSGRAPCAPGASFVPEANIAMGAMHLRTYLDYYGGDVELAVLAYNAGPTNVDEWLADPHVADRDDLLRLVGFGETREYLERVLRDRLIYAELYRDR